MVSQNSPLFQGLNPPQKEAVLHQNGPLLIFAGAGSGKTRVLVHRLAYLIEQGAKPYELLALTFTNKAAGEMKERVRKILGQRADEIWISTFHSMGVRLLRQHPDQAGLGPLFTILDDSDQMNLVKAALESLNINPKLFQPRAILSKINQAKNELLDAARYAARPHDFFDEKVARVYSVYEQNLVQNNAVDFGDLLVKPVRMFEAIPDLLSIYQNRFKFILVDEYQDTNVAQYRLVKLLAEKHRNLCVVGDDDQSIYRWRGADLRNILDFEKDFPGATVIKLEQNYRCSKNVLKAAGEIVKKIGERRDKTLWTENDSGEPLTVFKANNEKSEALFVVSEVKKAFEKGENYRDMAVFYRTNAQSRVLEDELRRQNIPYQIVGGTRFYDRSEVKDILAYLTVIANPKLSLSLKRIINIPARGIGKTSIEKLEGLASLDQKSLWEVLPDSKKAGLSGRTVLEIEKFIALIESLAKQFQHLPLAEALRFCLEKTGYLEMLRSENTLEAEDRLSNVEELLNVIGDYQTSVESPSLEGFLDQVTLASDLDLLTDQKGALPLMTLHLAKGLEFDRVFLTGLEEGLFPHSRSFDEPEQMDEERRLMYVGMTRAKKKLYLTHSGQRNLYGTPQFQLKSRFLEDIPEALIERPREIAKSAVGFEASFSMFGQAKQSISINAKNEELPKLVGRKVKHQNFGLGTIQACEGAEGDQKFTVKFENGEVKRLLARYANLEWI